MKGQALQTIVPVLLTVDLSWGRAWDPPPSSVWSTAYRTVTMPIDLVIATARLAGITRVEVKLIWH